MSRRCFLLDGRHGLADRSQCAVAGSERLCCRLVSRTAGARETQTTTGWPDRPGPGKRVAYVKPRAQNAGYQPLCLRAAGARQQDSVLATRDHAQVQPVEIRPEQRQGLDEIVVQGIKQLCEGRVVRVLLAVSQ